MHLSDGADDGRVPIVPQRILADLRKVMPPEGIVALDNGMYKIWFARNYRAPVSNLLLLGNALATMGRAALGDEGALLHPDRRVRSGSGWISWWSPPTTSCPSCSRRSGGAGVHLVVARVGHSENERVLADELRDRVPASTHV